MSFDSFALRKRKGGADWSGSVSNKGGAGNKRKPNGPARLGPEAARGSEDNQEKDGTGERGRIAVIVTARVPWRRHLLCSTRKCRARLPGRGS